MSLGSKSILGFLALLVLAVSGAAASEPCVTGAFVPVNFQVLPALPSAGDHVRIAVMSCGPCVRLVGLEGTDSLTVRARMRPFLCVPAVCFQDTLFADLDTLAAGEHAVTFRVIGEVIQADSSVCVAERSLTLTFSVRDTVPPGPLPYLEHVEIGTPVVCVRDPCPPLVCPFAPIPVSLAGRFNDDCIQLERVELDPVRAYPAPPRVRIVYVTNECIRRPCALGSFPWLSRVALPELPPGNYLLPVEADLVHQSCGDSLVESLGSIQVPFTVLESCPPPPPPPIACFFSEWLGADDVNACDAFVGDGQKAQLTLEVTPTVALAGLQGDLVLDSLALEVTDMRPLGPAAGMHLGWRTTPRGARFVMLAERGAPIPPQLMDCRLHCGWPVLEVTLAPRPGMPLPRVTRLTAVDLMASDSLGKQVTDCSSIYGRPMLATVANICAEGQCDFNGDGASDVRDLVLMVHCILGVGACPEPRPTDLDCNADGVLGVDDVLCCARAVLGGGIDDTIPGRPEPGARISMGAPIQSGEHVEVPVSLEGAGLLGAARLAIEFPADRYDLESAELDGAPADWLALHERQGNQVIVGLIGLSGATRSDLVLRLRLALKPGMPSGGQVRLAAGEFAAPDGAALAIASGPSTQSLGALTRVALSAPEPNPFTRSVRFSVVAGQGCDLEVGVYDLAGREVRAIHRGWTPAGTLDLAWDGRQASGARARAGLYFVRASGAGESRVRRIALLAP